VGGYDRDAERTLEEEEGGDGGRKNAGSERIARRDQPSGREGEDQRGVAVQRGRRRKSAGVDEKD
jgi:hypothetical protein